jgi:signal peptidase I
VSDKAHPPPPPPEPEGRGLGRVAKVAIAVGAVIGVLALVVVAAAVTGLIKTYRAPSPAMEPTIHIGDHFVVARMTWPFSGPGRGDIVVFHPPPGADTNECGVPSAPGDGHPCPRPVPGESSNTFVKRIVAVPGDRLAISDNRVVLNGKPLRETFIARGSPCGELCNLRKEITIPKGHYFVMGDNRGESSDSRVWGPVPRDAMVGRMLFGY